LQSSITFNIEDVPFPDGFDGKGTMQWLLKVAEQEGKEIRELHYFFCSDAHLGVLNEKFLKHSDFTDVITFPYDYDPIEADIYVSLDRIAENAITYAKNDFFDELNRVVVHGLLHMCEYNDGNDADKANMRSLELHYLSKRKP